ncbi:MAG: glycosyltransferase [Candidatus Marithrix sp.]
MQIIVLGMHRSGTSMVARLLNMMGAYFAPDELAMQASDANPKGHWEREDIRALNDEILQSLGMSWDNLSNFEPSLLTETVYQKFSARIQKIIFNLDSRRPWMIKDPRLNLLLPMWARSLEVPVCIHVYRNPIQIAQSLQKRETDWCFTKGATLFSIREANFAKEVNFPVMLGIALWEKYTLNALYNSRFLPKILVSFHDLINNPVATTKALYKNLSAYEIQGLRLPSSREILAYIEPNLHREQGSNKLQKKYINTQQAKLVRSFQTGKILTLSSLPILSGGAAETLQEYQNNLLAANKILAIQKQVVQCDDDIIEFGKEITKRDKDLLNQQAHITQLTTHIDKLTLNLQEQTTTSECQTIELRYEIDMVNNRLQVYKVQKEQELARKEQEFAEQKRELDNQTQHIAVLTEQNTQLNIDINKLIHWLFALDNDVKAVFKSLTWRVGNIITQIALKLSLKKPEATAKEHIQAIIQEVTKYRLSARDESQYQLPSPSAETSQVDNSQEFKPHILTLPTTKDYELWYNFNQCQADDLEYQQQTIKTWDNLPIISIIIPTFNSTTQWLDALLFSIHSQTYPYWECLIIDDASTTTEHLPIVKKWCLKNSKFQLIEQDKNQGVSNTCQVGIDQATGSYVCVADHDDQLEPQALFEIAKILQHQQPDVLYSDEMLTNEDGTMIRCEFRPDFNYYFLLSHPYIIHLTVMRRELLLEVGGFKQNLQVSQDYDLLLRIAAISRSFVHIPKVLYRWRTHTGSTGHQQSDNVMQASITALDNHLQLAGLNDSWTTKGLSFNFFRIRHKISPVKVSVIIPTKDRVDLLKTCIDSFQQNTYLPNGVEVEFLIVDNNSEQPESFAYFDELKDAGHIILTEPGLFNYSLLNNKAAQQASGSVLLFMNNDIEIIEAGWLEAMLELITINEVGVVGAKLLYPPELGLIQHAGVMIFNDAAGHDHQFFPEFETQSDMAVGHNGALLAIRECLAVTGACMMVQRSAFEAVGRFDETLHVGFGDTDLCLKLREVGHKCLITPYARLIHHESATRGYQVDDPHPEDSELFCSRWDTLIKKGDPYYNSNLNPRGKMFEPLFIKIEDYKR